jgi:hypothetical protein
MQATGKGEKERTKGPRGKRPRDRETEIKGETERPRDRETEKKGETERENEKKQEKKGHVIWPKKV